MASDGIEQSVATVIIEVTDASGNTRPVAVDYAYGACEGRTRGVDAARGLLANDTDADGDVLVLAGADQPAHGTAVFSEGGSFTYTPDAGFIGTDFFEYNVTDGVDVSNIATVTITVTVPEANEPPTRRADKYKAVQDKLVTVNAAKGVLANDSDPDGDKLTAHLDTAPGHGRVTLNPDGSLTYTPKAGFRGKDRFTYRPFVGTTSGNVVLVQLTIGKAASQPSTADASSGDEVATSADSPSAPSSSNSLSQRKQLLATSLPNTGASPRSSGHDANAWLPLTALAVLVAVGAVGFVGRSLA